jgi:hypothetical protein
MITRPTLKLLLATTLGIVAPYGVHGQGAGDAFADFIGVWETHDTYYPAAGEPQAERGVRTCKEMLRGEYLHCETMAANEQMIGNTEANHHYSELVFEDEDRIVWTGRRVDGETDPQEAPISFVETWERRSADPPGRGRRTGPARWVAGQRSPAPPPRRW